MPSQSRSEGESMPDHLTRTESPDLERVVVFREMETWCWKEGLKKKKRKRKKMKKWKETLRGTILGDQ